MDFPATGLTVSFTRPVYMFNEDDGTGRVTVELSGPTSVPVTVSVEGGLHPVLPEI